MRIVAHNGAKIFGGAERATLALLGGLRSRGHSVTLLSNSDVVARNAEALGIDCEMCVIGGDPMIHHAARLGATLRRLRPDAFIIGTFKKLFLAGLGARLAGVPKIVARVGLETDTPRSAKYRYALRHHIDHVAVNAQRLVLPFAALEGFSPKKVRLIHNGVIPVDDGDRGRIRSECGLADSDFVVGTVARLAKQKRIDRLVRAVALMPGVKCIVAGAGAMRAELESMIGELNLGDRVHLLGSREDKADVFAALDVFVLASDAEGLSNAMLEAMSAGVPVVSTAVSGAHDALMPDSTKHGGIIAGFTPESIASAIDTLRNNPQMRATMGMSARDIAAHDFSMDGMLDKWEALLESRAPA